MRRLLSSLAAVMALLCVLFASPAHADDDVVKGSISGTVTLSADDGGGPLANICVTAGSNDHGVKSGETDSDGKYELTDMQLGTWIVSFNACTAASGMYHEGEYGSPADPLVVELTEEEPHGEADRTLRQGGEIAGSLQVVDLDQVEIVFVGPGDDGPFSHRNILTFGVGADGTFGFVLPAGDHRVVVREQFVSPEISQKGWFFGGGYQARTACVITIEAGEITDLGTATPEAFEELDWSDEGTINSEPCAIDGEPAPGPGGGDDDDEGGPTPGPGGGGGGGAPAPAPSDGDDADEGGPADEDTGPAYEEVLAQLPPPAAERTPTGTVHRLYVALLGRVADDGGLDYWVGLHEQGHSLTSIARQIATSPEFVSNFGVHDDEEFLHLLYEHVLGRSPDEGGLDYWMGILSSGQASREHVILLFADSPELIASIRAALS